MLSKVKMNFPALNRLKIRRVNDFYKMCKRRKNTFEQELDSSNYGYLEERLQQELPYSLKTYYPVKLLRKGVLKDKRVLVDQWPDFKTVLVTDKQRMSTPHRVYCFCKDDNSTLVDSILRQVSNELGSSLVLFGCSPGITDELIKMNGSFVRRLIEDTGMLMFPREIFRKPTLPDGFKEKRLEEENVELVLSNLPYREAKEYIVHMINILPSTCILNKDDKPVAWILQQEYGCCGMLHVMPEYRRLNLGSIVGLLQAEKIFENGDEVYSWVDKTNHPALTYNLKNGLVPLPDFIVTCSKYMYRRVTN